MTDVFLQRSFDPPLSEDGFRDMSRDAESCFGLYRVEWQESFLSADGRRLICRLTAPDVESARGAFRKSGSPEVAPWAGTVHDAPSAAAPSVEEANVLVERSFEEPVTMEEIQAIEDAGAWCLDAHDVRFVRTFFSRDRKRMICLYRAPDAEAVRVAQRKAEMPVDDVWGFRRLRPPSPA
jgi:hypothetical protein